MADDLYEVRNCLALGNFHQAIAEGTNAKCASKKAEDVQAFNTERDSLVAQAQVCLGQYDIVLGDLKNATAPLLLATKHWAALHKELNAGQLGDEAYRNLVAIAGETPSALLAPVAVLAASAAAFRGDFTTSLKTAATWAAAIDAKSNGRQVIALRAVAVDGFLRLNRVDLAEKEVTAMRAIDDDAIPCLMTSILVSLRQGAVNPNKFSDAEITISEIVGRCGQSVSLLNYMALAKLGQGKPQEAEQHLLDALSKRSGDPETIANLAVVSIQLGKPFESSSRFVTQAKASGPHSPWVKTLQNMEQRFRDAAVAAAS